ncbi:hypothetical protein [uncultured Fusobacterium sp.]|uniref:hypothetical protein n=1 Tax=uncultured Fusobacterium sp. TaxID=159267 RepID=UPI00261C194D|nr:hypothetical protein [uncultured Fusobacterium sp.]
MKNFKDIIMILVLFILGVVITVVLIDPFFHYHKPLKKISYFMDNNQQRYMNDGIVKNFEYDSIITGTSMTENFRSSQFDNLFNSKSIKVPFSGGSYREINNIVDVSLKNKRDVKYILRGLDYGKIREEYSKMSYGNYPTYLYDDNILNDYKYILSKGAFFQSLINLIKSLKSKENINFDEYSSWRNKESGRDVVLRTYKRDENKKEEEKLTLQEIEIIKENIEKNVIELPKKYPDVKFIYFITPYSIVYWDSINQSGDILKQLEAEKIMIEIILEIPNIELYSFFNNYELITDLNNYTDAGHYNYKINDKILEWISRKEYRLTKENYKKYLEENKEFYLNYDYDKIFQ